MHSSLLTWRVQYSIPKFLFKFHVQYGDESISLLRNLQAQMIEYLKALMCVERMLKIK